MGGDGDSEFPLDALGLLRPMAERLHAATQAPLPLCSIALMRAADAHVPGNAKVRSPDGRVIATEPMTDYYDALMQQYPPALREIVIEQAEEMVHAHFAKKRPQA
jgi:hypothetical protein